MEELREKYIFPVHLNHAEMINYGYLPKTKSKSRAGSKPCKNKRKRKNKHKKK